MCANSKQPDNWYIFYNYICMLLEITKYDNNETDMQENVTLQYTVTIFVLSKQNKQHTHRVVQINR